MNCSNLAFAPSDPPHHFDDEQGAFTLPTPLPREIRSMREFMGLTHHELAEKLGVSVFLVRYWEQGSRAITPTLAAELRKIYERKMGFDALD